MRGSEADMSEETHETSIPEGPYLLATFDRRLSPEAVAHIRKAFDQFRSGEARLLIADEGMKFYQLIDGRWCPVDQQGPDLPGKDVITLREERKGVAEPAYWSAKARAVAHMIWKRTIGTR
jgi:hypothetical protein